MCRMAGYLGPPQQLRSILTDPPHSLERQSYAHRELRNTVVNADGWGAAWYLDGDVEACAYRTVHPIWADSNRASLGRTVTAGCLLAAVRAATDPLSVSIANTQPFTAESLAFLHNGYLRGFREQLLRPLREALSDASYQAIRGDTDSEHLFATIHDAHRHQNDLVAALQDAVPRVLHFAAQTQQVALAALLVSDGQSLVAVRAATGDDPPTLYVSQRTSDIRFASEPLDSSPWEALEPGVIYRAHANHVHLEPLW